MKAALATGLALIVGTPAMAANTAHLSPNALAMAINAADSQVVPYRRGSLSPSDIRHIRCVGPDEEPTEFECSWQQHTGHGWTRRHTWVATTGEGWQVIG